MDPRLKVIIEVLDRATKPLANMHRQMLANVRRIQIALLAAGATLAAFITLAIKGSEAQRMSMARLELHAGRMGPAFTAAAKAISDTFGKALGFSQAQIADLLVLLVQFTSPEIATAIAGSVAILARALNKSLPDAASLFQRALAGDTDAITELIKAGVPVGTDFRDALALATAITKAMKKAAEEGAPATAKLGAAWANLLATLGGGKGGPFDQFSETLATILSKIDDFLTEHPDFVAALDAIALAAAGLIAMFLLLLAWLRAMMVLAPVWGVAVALMTEPIVLVGLTIIGLLITAWLLWKQWQKIWGDVETTTAEKVALTILSILALNPIFRAVIVAMEWMRDHWRDLWAEMNSETSRNVLEMLGPIGKLISAIMDAIAWLDRLFAKQRMAPINISSGPVPIAVPQPLPHFAQGGVVPGLLGEPMMAVVHGGERVIPRGAGAGGNFIVNGNIYGMDNLRALVYQWVRDARRGGGFQT